MFSRLRQAFIEARLQNLLLLSDSRKCDAIDDRIELLGDEDTAIGFTLYGFGRFKSAAHFQYYLGVIEANCGRTKQANNRWSKVAKLKESPASPDFAYPFLAASRMGAAGAKDSTTRALKTFEAAGDSGNADVRTLNHGLLLRAAGQSAPALAELIKAARESKDAMVQYLATVELGRKAE
jgi:hypothetical protein